MQTLVTSAVPPPRLVSSRLVSSLDAVLALVVPPKIHLALEALGADVTSEGLEAGVLAAVGDQVGALAEGFAAHLAFVGLLSCEVKETHRDDEEDSYLRKECDEKFQ